MSGTPAGAIETGKVDAFILDLGLALGDGERGVDKGGTLLVEGAAVGGELVGAEVVRARIKGEEIRSADARWRQRWQIIVGLIKHRV